MYYPLWHLHKGSHNKGLSMMYNNMKITTLISSLETTARMSKIVNVHNYVGVVWHTFEVSLSLSNDTLYFVSDKMWYTGEKFEKKLLHI